MVRDRTVGGVEGQSWKQQMYFPLGKAHVCPLGRFQTCFQSASTSVILGLSFPIWNGRASQRVESGMMLSVGRYQEGIFCPRAGLQWGPGWSREERPGLGDSRQVPKATVMRVESRQPGPWLLWRVRWSRAFEQVAGCFLSWLPLQAIHQLSCYCLGQRVAINAPTTSHRPPPPRKWARFYVVRTLWGVSNTPLMTGIMKQ